MLCVPGVCVCVHGVCVCVCVVSGCVGGCGCVGMSVCGHV